MLASMGVYVHLHIPEVPDIKVPDIPPVTNFSETLGYKDSYPPTYQHHHHNSIIRNESITNTVSPKKYLVDFLKMVNSCNIYGRRNMFHIFTFWFEEYLIPFYNNNNKTGKTDE